MARLGSCFCFCNLLLLLSFAMSEARPLRRNHNPFSSHIPVFLNTVKKDGIILHESAKVSLKVEMRSKNNATGRQYYDLRRVSPGGPDAHHHLKTVAIGGNGRKLLNFFVY
ncbi:hypothetical protein PIB30_039687 [Stylosanthes scabra]|uniref:Uncharacterized protein n=1 Tax=Stylosanthes scabra TaxID=79078 RepID=A0ABU6WEK8_9FABA|nr:hypothetical protein [Stylosanthes scabra]